ncbi:MAG: ABC transporter permease [Lachnospiraceae bacterium]|nr:ABC transporter permease [Lachnospiraceae bacterium]
MEKKRAYSLNFIIGAVITGVMLVLILTGFIHTPYDITKMDSTAKLAAPSLEHLMGCDNFGRDIFSRVLKGMGNTFTIAVATVAIGAVCGVLIGAFTGYFGGWLDEVLMRINDVVFAFPSILLALVFVSIFGTGKYNVVAALGIAFIPSFARIVRGEFIKYKDMDYVKSARLAGVPKLRIIFVHILPNTMPVLMSSIMIGFNNAVLAEAGMSYLGIGVQPPDASLGSMLSESQTYLFSAPWYAAFPGLMIILMVLGFSLLADGNTKRV